MGATDSMPYHTGTTQNSRTSYSCCQYRNIEGLWDNVYDWMDGCYYNGSGLNVIKNPNQFSDSANGVSVGTPSNGYPSKFTVKTNGGFPLFIPTAANGSDSTYSCDAGTSTRRARASSLVATTTRHRPRLVLRVLRQRLVLVRVHRLPPPRTPLMGEFEGAKPPHKGPAP